MGKFREPSESDFEIIRSWDARDIQGLMEYVQNIWRYADCGYFRKYSTGIYRLSTGGWSDNEEIIRNLQANQMWWIMNWRSSLRGGHYTFGRTTAGDFMEDYHEKN